jgi:hypothetical protein
MSTFNLSKRIRLSNPAANIDSTYGPYNSVSEANTAVNQLLRVIGRTVIINVAGTAVEYWWESGVEDSDLVEKVLGTNTDIPAILFDDPGVSLKQGVTAAEVRNLISAGTSSLVLGTSSSTALAGDTVTISGSQASAISANTLKVSDTGDPAILSNGGLPELNTGITAAEIRALIGAGTSTIDDNNYVKNNLDTYTGTGKVKQIITLSQAEYDNITTPLSDTLYIIL